MRLFNREIRPSIWRSPGFGGFQRRSLHDRTPGYPLLLVVSGSIEQPTRALFFVSLALHFASVWLLAALLHAAGLGHRWLLIFAGLLLLPPYIEPAAYVMTENLAQFMLVVGFACLLFWFTRRRSMLLAVSAIALGYCALTRPAYQALTAVIAVCLFLIPSTIRRARVCYRDAVTGAGVLLFGSVLMLGSLSTLNYVKFNYFGITPSIGFHLSTKTMPFVERLPEEYTVVREILIRERDSELTKRGGRVPDHKRCGV